MCGIAGILVTDHEQIDPHLLYSFNEVQSHRGPDDKGIYVKHPVGLAMTRLSIIDLSLNAHQPMSNEDGTVWIVFNGEIYNHDQIRKELKIKGHKYKSNSDTESIIHLYEEYDTDCLHYLNGMFAFAIWDSVKQRLFLARDRLGVKPLYYSKINNCFCFASEIKAILCHPAVSKEVDITSMDQYFSYGAIPHPKTIYRHVSILEPGYFLLVENSSIKKYQYWDLGERLNDKDHSVYITDENEYIHKVIDRLKKAVKLRLMSDVPLGVFLSGGVDSSLITALMSEVSSRPVKTFSVGFQDGDPHMNELKYCRIVSKKYSTEHHEFIQTSNIEEILPKVITHFDEPFANPTAIPMYHISRLASNTVKVVLSGVGGDELFGGYPRHLFTQWIKYWQIVPEVVKKSGLLIVSRLQRAPDSYSVLDRLRRLFLLETGTDAIVYEGLRTIYSPYQKNDLFEKAITEEINMNNDGRGAAIAEIFRKASGKTPVDRALFTDILNYLPTDLLTYCDRMSMATSLEIRVPFCDYEFVEFAMTIPSRLKVKQFQLKHLLKKAALNYLPSEVIYRRKQGFSVPVGYWLKDNLSSFLNQYLSEDFIKRQGYFNYSFIHKMLHAHNTGRANYANHLWTLLIFQMWYQQYMM
jgi:asparagine synthase (glutamine-hydrolysing)